MPERDFGESNGSNTSDEEILNAFRRSNEDVLGTAEVAEELNIGVDQTRNRLNNLREGGRVGTRKIGNTRVWVLSRGEQTWVVNTEIARIQRVCRVIADIARWVLVSAVGAFVLGGVILIAYLAVVIGETSVGMVEPNELASWGLGLLGAGGFVAFVGGLVMAATFAIERIAKWNAVSDSSPLS